MLSRQDPESLWLDYKASPYLLPPGRGGGIDKQKRADELSKDVTAFLNADGGSLVCGIREDEGTEATGGAPVPLASFDPAMDGHAKSDITKETIENIITSNIQPKLSPDLYYVSEVGIEGRIVFIVDVAKSMTGPFQARDKRYYERFHYKSEPMEHYRIEEVRNLWVAEFHLGAPPADASNRVPSL